MELTVRKEASYDFREVFGQYMEEVEEQSRYYHPVFLCIGTDRITGDCFGPLVGSNLERLLAQEEVMVNTTVMGTIENPISSHNIQQAIDAIYKRISAPYIIAIDAALSCRHPVGKVLVERGGMCLGKGLGKQPIQIGDLSIKGIVARDLKRPEENFRLLQNTPLRIVMKLASEVSYEISEVMKEH